ncbi:DNA-binding protein [Streptomyces sp. NPDC047017]|uniref:DNA-binding protein n=1 Tax=Streptomyces sp. NPDC047017 TaxID=3155024 RepID=UPI0033F885DB
MSAHHPPKTLLKQLCDERGLDVPKLIKQFDQKADQVVGKGANNPTCSERTAKRWRAGGVNPSSLSTDTRLVLESLFGRPIADLFAPPPQIDPHAPSFDLEQEINMTARDAQEDASATAAASISDTNLDQLTDDVVALARDYASIAPTQAFHRGQALKLQLQDQRDRTQVPAQQQRLLELLGQTTALLATSAFNLGSFDASRRLARSADLYGEAARCEPLRAYCDGILAYVCYFTGMPGEAAAKARRAQTYSGLGDVARRRLLAIEARAHGYLGDVDSAQRAVRLSEGVESGARDSLHDDVAGEFGFSMERLAMSSSSTALLIGDAAQAEQSARRALHLIEMRPTTARSAHVLGSASADLAMAHLLDGNVEAASEALTPLWDIPADQRVTGVLVRTGQIQHYLTRPVFRGSAVPTELRDRVEDFTRSAATHQLTAPALLQLEA